MAKLSCSYFLVLMIVFSVCLMVEKTEGKVCEITLKVGTDCIRFFCAQDCAGQYYGGLGYCFDDPKVPGPLNCRCRYDC
ncbi:hypothetical protein F2Q68_00006622 [Brassica cretica]|uniref:Knottin scorpion toxin-like domain-containing protein n=1 Tax=Brassica cretica TaxID=69181 RepID=A0A8S9JLN5_BRACR|nr:hypothetical protein F2Q68_00006622 [Brassica cretica]